MVIEPLNHRRRVLIRNSLLVINLSRGGSQGGRNKKSNTAAPLGANSGATLKLNPIGVIGDTNGEIETLGIVISDSGRPVEMGLVGRDEMRKALLTYAGDYKRSGRFLLSNCVNLIEGPVNEIAAPAGIVSSVVCGL